MKSQIIRLIQSSLLPITLTASENHNVTNNIPREKSEEWAPCFLHKLRHNNASKDMHVDSERINNGAALSKLRDVSGNHWRNIALSEREVHRAFQQSTQPTTWRPDRGLMRR